MRVFGAGLATETNTFSPIATTMTEFESYWLVRPGNWPEAGGSLSAAAHIARKKCQELDGTFFEGTCAGAPPSGRTTKACYEFLRDEILSQVKSALPLDVVILDLHGAMVAEGYDDCEGDLLTRVRQLVGDQTIIGAELDPHCHLTPAMTEMANVIVIYKEYPHTDIGDRARELVNIAFDAYAKRVRPVMSVCSGDFISVYHTTKPPMIEFVQDLKAVEKKESVLSVSAVHGFPWGDVPEVGSKMLVVTDSNESLGETIAKRLIKRLDAIADDAFTPLRGLEETLCEVRDKPDQVFVLADTADNAGGGAPGDSTFVLQALLEENIASCVGPLFDPEAVLACFEAGVGEKIRLPVGGKLGVTSGDSLDLEAEVLSHNDHLQQTFANTSVPLGRAAAIRVKSVDIVLTSIRSQALGRELFTDMGCAFPRYQVICVKSSQHFYDAFSKLADQVLYVDTPGALVQDWRMLQYHKLKRKVRNLNC